MTDISTNIKSSPPDPKMRSPAAAATGQGENADKSFMGERNEKYLKQKSLAILKLGPIRRELYASGEWTPEALAYTRRHRLDLPTIQAHAGIFAVCLCRFYGGDNGEGLFQFDADGVPAALVEALAADGHSVLDLVAWRLDAPDTYATAIHNADMLGAWHMLCRGGRPLHVHRTPINWLRAGCEGCVVLNPDWGDHWLQTAGGPFIAEDVHHGRKLREMLGDKASRHSIFVRRSEVRVAS